MRDQLDARVLAQHLGSEKRGMPGSHQHIGIGDLVP
jgi:hypothetical protein